MATVDVPWDWFVFKVKAYYHMVKVKKIQLPAAHRFGTAEVRTSLSADSAPGPGLFRVNPIHAEILKTRSGWGGADSVPPLNSAPLYPN